MIYLSNRKRFIRAISSGSNLLLDESISGTWFGAYSMARKLKSSYSGSAFRVRRSSDNGEQDIGFSGNNIDTDSLTSFTGVDDGFIVTIYDQSGNARHVTNATTTQQPLIVSLGEVLVDGDGHIYANFDGADDNLLFNVTQALPITMFGVVKPNSITDEDVFYSGGSSSRQAIRANDVATDEYRLLNGGTGLAAITAWTLNQVLICSQCNTTGTNDTIRINAGSEASGSAGDNSLTSIAIGSSTTVLNFNFSELVISSNFNLASDETIIRNNINNFYTLF